MIMHTTTIRFLPSVVAKVGERAGWLAPVFTIVPFTALVFIIQALFKNDKEANLSLSEIIFKSLGRILGTVLLIIYLAWMLISLGLFVRFFAEKFLASMLPNTPQNFFTVTILAVIFYALQGGIIYVARTIEFLFLAFSIVIVIMFLLTVPNIDIINLLPVTYYDIWPIIKASYFNLGMWSAFTFTFFFGDRINNKEHIKRFGLQATLYLTVITLLILIQTIGVYGHSVIERISLSYIFVIKGISVLETIERIESIAIASWVIIDFAAISFYAFAEMSIMKSLFSLSQEKSLISPVIIFAFIFSNYIAGNRFELERFITYINTPLNIIFGFVFPLIILVIGKARKKI